MFSCQVRPKWNLLNQIATKAVPKNHPNRLETIASIANYSLSNKVHSSSIIESVINLADNSDEENLLSRYALSILATLQFPLVSMLGVVFMACKTPYLHTMVKQWSHSTVLKARCLR